MSIKSMSNSELLVAAEQAIRSKEYERGLTLWEEASLRIPMDTGILISLAFAKERVGQTAGAIDVCKTALDVARVSSWRRQSTKGIYLTMARCYSKLGQKVKAIQFLDEALVECPQYREALTLKATIAQASGNRDAETSARRELEKMSSPPRYDHDRRRRRRSRSPEQHTRSRSRSRSRGRDRSRTRSRSPIQRRPVPSNAELLWMNASAIKSLTRELQSTGRHRDAVTVHTQYINDASRPERVRTFAYVSRAFSYEKLQDYKSSLTDLKCAEELALKLDAQNERIVTKQRIELARSRISAKTENNVDHSLEMTNALLKDNVDYLPALKHRYSLHKASGRMDLAAADDARINAIRKGEHPKPAAAAIVPVPTVVKKDAIVAPVPNAIAPAVKKDAVVAPASNAVVSAVKKDAVVAPVHKKEEVVPAVAPAVSAAVVVVAKNGFRGWNLLKLGDWFASHGEAYKSYVSLVVDNSLDGDTLQSFCAEGAEGLTKVLIDLGITKDVHRRVLVSHILATSK